jgi:NAD-dependent dihydropyrimidine dehydrogenase PreA subunit
VRKYTINDECIYCGSCEPECPEAAISDDLEAGAYVIDPARCTGCPEGDPPPCVAACPVDAVIRRPAPTAPGPQLQLLRFRGVLRATGQTARLLIADLRFRLPPGREVTIAPRSPCELELEGGRRLRLSLEHARVFAPGQEERGPWIAVQRSVLAEAVLESAPPTPHSFTELAGAALCAGDRVVVVGEVLEQTFVEGTGGFREAPRAVPTRHRVRFVAADEPESLALLEAALERLGVIAVEG